MHVPTGPDGERQREWMTAGVLCVHGAEQGETLYGTTQHSSPTDFFLLHPHFLPTVKSNLKQNFSVGLLCSQISLVPIKTQSDPKLLPLFLFLISHLVLLFSEYSSHAFPLF